MIVRGVDTNLLPDQFKGCVAGRTLILDGDGPCYEVAATVKRLDTAVRHFQQKMLTALFLTKSQDAIIHLTASGSRKAGRFDVLAQKPYQGQRAGKPKPALLEPLRQAVAQRQNWLEEYRVVMHYDLEADDGMIQDAYRLKEDGVIWSEDKDLRMTPYPYWDRDRCAIQQSQPFGMLEMKYTPKGVAKCVGQGPLFFWAQMLMGDQADHIQGVLRLRGVRCGAVGAYNELHGAPDIHAAANLVLDGYRAINQNPLPEGSLLWLLRWPGDSFENYLKEMELSDANRRFIADCSAREWRKPPGGNPEAC